LTLIRHPVIHACLQDVERHAAADQHLVMEGFEIEARAQAPLGSLAELPNLQLADLVAEALRRPGDIAIDFRLNRGRETATTTRAGREPSGVPGT
jgi:hypothetical protein